MIRIFNAIMRKIGRVQLVGGCRRCGNTHTNLRYGLCAECATWLAELTNRNHGNDASQPKLF